MTFEIDEDTLRCIFSGDLDSVACSEISKALSSEITEFAKNRDAAYLVFDLTDVRYICSAFLRICLYHCKQVGTRNFRIENPSTEVNRVLQIAGFPDVITIV